MRYNFRKGTVEDVKEIMGNTTENGKVDLDVARESDEIRVFEYRKKPIMVIGCVSYPEEDMRDVLGVWGVFSKDIKKHTKTAVQFCKDLIFDRVNTKFVVLIDEGNPTFIRFVEFFGFQRTKFVEQHGETVYHLYVKVN